MEPDTPSPQIQLTTSNKIKQPQKQAKKLEPESKQKQRQSPQPQSEPQKVPTRLKSQGRMIFLGLIISLSALNLGYSMKQITSVPIDTLIQHYNITISSFAATSILIGIMPIGAILGVLITVRIMHHVRRVTGIYIFTVVNCVGIVLININFFATLVTGRFIEGVSIGFYATIAPIYLREMAPKQLRRLLGLFFSLGKIIGVIYVILLEIVLREAGVTIAYRIILSFTAVFSILQVILIFIFGSNTPTQMMESDDKDEARAIIEQLYKPEYVQELLKQYTQEYEAAFHQGEDPQKQAKKQKDIKKNNVGENSIQNIFESKNETSLQVQTSQPNKNQSTIKPEKKTMLAKSNKIHNSDMIPDSQPEQELTFQQKKSQLFCLGAHMCALRQYTGGNVLLVQGGLFIATFNKTLGQYTPLIINLVQFAAIIFGIAYLQKKIGKKPAFLFSLSTMSVLNFAIVIAMIFQQIIATLILMCIFMLVFGGSFINQNWAYPAQVIPAREATIPNIIHWFTMSTSNLIPPLVSGAMPNNNPFPVFVFFGIYCFIGFVHVRAKLQQTDGFTYMEIVKSMK